MLVSVGVGQRARSINNATMKHDFERESVWAAALIQITTRSQQRQRIRIMTKPAGNGKNLNDDKDLKETSHDKENHKETQ
jgi:hypothetical protein